MTKSTNIFSNTYNKMGFPGGPIDDGFTKLPQIEPPIKKGSYYDGRMPPPWDSKKAREYVNLSFSKEIITPPSHFFNVDVTQYSNSDSQRSYPSGSGDSGITPPS
jgi:hypothetical protein